MAKTRGMAEVQRRRRARTKGKGGRRGKTVVMRKRGKKAVKFQKGGLHRSLGVPEGKKIPASKMRAARAGRYGPKAKKQAVMATGMLAKGRRTAARGKRKAKRAAKRRY